MFLHLYAQETYHQEAFIVGTRPGLEALKRAIDKAFMEGQGEAEVSVSDGEGYTVVILLKEDGAFWDKAAVPYTVDYAAPKDPTAIWPGAIWKEEKP